MKIDDDFEFKIARLQLQPGDILVVKVDRPISRIQCNRIHDLFAGVGVPNKTLVLELGIDLAVLSPTPTDHELAARTDDELREMLHNGEISRNQIVRAQAARSPAEKPKS